MKFKNPLLAVKDMDASKAFYREVLGLRVVADFGANVTLTGGVCLQTEESWKKFIRSDGVVYGGKGAELYFEEDEFDAFAEKLRASGRAPYVHPVFEHRWGQRVVRFFDPDGHIVEVGENISAVCARFAASGMTEAEIAARMDVPVAYIRAHTKSRR